MPDLLAKGVAASVGLLLVLVIAILYVTSQPPAGANQVKAEFDNAFPLIEGMHVRVDGAIAGSVASIDVNDQGNAVVTLSLNGSVEEPMADATAAIRQQDTTGDSYVAFDPGGDDPDSPESSEPLGDEGIVCDTHDTCSKTLIAPRLDDLLNAFGPAERAGVQLTLVEFSKALDRRGADLNAAALELRPAVEEANQALTEINEQNTALKSLIKSAESVTGQAASKKRELATLIDSLAVTTNVTAAESAALDAGLERLPDTAREAQATLAALTRTANAAQPLANQLAQGAPDLAGALSKLPAFLDDASAFLDDNRSTLELTRRLLRAAQPALEIGNKRVITGPFDLTGATADLLNSVLGGEDAFPALFGDDSYGEGEGTLGKRGFGAVAVEPGDLPGYPAEHEPRNWLRVSAVINCEVFGVPVEPGCLADVLSGGGVPSPRATGDRRTKGFDRSKLPGAGSRPDTGSGSSGGNLGLPDLPGLDRNDLDLDGALKGLGKGKKKGKGKKGKGGLPGRPNDMGAKGLQDLIDYLTGDG